MAMAMRETVSMCIARGAAAAAVNICTYSKIYSHSHSLSLFPLLTHSFTLSMFPYRTLYLYTKTDTNIYILHTHITSRVCTVYTSILSKHIDIVEYNMYVLHTYCMWHTKRGKLWLVKEEKERKKRMLWWRREAQIDSEWRKMNER